MKIITITDENIDDVQSIVDIFNTQFVNCILMTNELYTSVTNRCFIGRVQNLSIVNYQLLLTLKIMIILPKVEDDYLTIDLNKNELITLPIKYLKLNTAKADFIRVLLYLKTYVLKTKFKLYVKIMKNKLNKFLL
jgi:hypothetical protein